MKTKIFSSRLGQRAYTITELMVALAISSLMSGGLISGSYLMQKSYAASRHHVEAQADQMRLMDYMGLDLRRALSVTTSNGQLKLTIPDYYDSGGKPREPVFDHGLVKYGSVPVYISYFKRGAEIYRKEGVTEIALATDVADFEPTFQDLGLSIKIAVTFLPRYQFSKNRAASVRDGTALYSTTLLRNVRQQYIPQS